MSSDLLQVCNHFTRPNIESNAANFAESWFRPTAAGPPVVAALAGVTRGAFTFGFDLEAFGAASSTQRIESGINTTALQMYWNLETTAGTTFGGGVANRNLEAHSWAQYDCLLTCSNGQMYARF